MRLALVVDAATVVGTETREPATPLELPSRRTGVNTEAVEIGVVDPLKISTDGFPDTVDGNCKQMLMLSMTTRVLLPVRNGNTLLRAVDRAVDLNDTEYAAPPLLWLIIVSLMDFGV